MRGVAGPGAQEEERTVAVGFFFSLGHSTIVVLLSIVVAIAAGLVENSIPALKGVGGLIGTSVSAFFLHVIGLINLLVFLDIFRMFRRVAREGTYSEETLEEFLAQRLDRCPAPLTVCSHKLRRHPGRRLRQAR